MVFPVFLSEVGRFKEAKSEVRRALELDPLSPIISNTIAAVYFRNRQYDQAIDQLHRLLAADPNFVVAHELLGQLYTQKQMYDAAIQSARAVVEFRK